MSKTRIHYMATRADGTVPPTDELYASAARRDGEPVWTTNLADHIGRTIVIPDPSPGFYTDRPFPYFHMITRPGEVLEGWTEDWGWPIRLWIVEPRGETNNWGGSYYPYWMLSHQIHVVAETEVWRAFGHRGVQVQQTLDQIPDLARQWAARWAADPRAAHDAHAAWTEQMDERHALDWWVRIRAQYSRRTAALNTATRLAQDAAEQAATAAGVDTETVTAIRLRARALITGQLLHDRIRTGEHEKSIRALLLGAGLELPVPVAV